MTTFRSGLVAALTFLGSAAQAHGLEPAGIETSWSTRIDEQGRVHLTGSNEGQRFQLKVLRNGFVSGRIGARPVRYWITPSQYAGLVHG
jgi:hypothetical protein